MADEIKDATILRDNFAPAAISNSTSSLSYLFRYQALTDDGIPTTEWSPIHITEDTEFAGIVSGYTPSYRVSSVESAGVGINVKWTVPDSLATSTFDVYLNWSYDNGVTYAGWTYFATVTSNSFYAEIPTVSSVKAQYVKVAVQLPTTPQILNNNAKLFETTAQATKAVLDGGGVV